MRRQYDALASRYDRRWAAYLARSQALVLEGLAPAPGEAVLDVGCGTGQVLEALSGRFPGLHLTGADLSPAMLRAAAGRLGGDAVLVRADATRLPFPDAGFDWVVSASMFHYLDRPEAAIREWHRVLRPGGTLRLVDWSLDFRTMRLLDRLLRHLDPAHHRTWREAALHDLLQHCGFELRDHQRRKINLLWGLLGVSAVRGGTVHA